MRTRLDLTFTVAASTALLLAGCQRQTEWTAGSDTAVCRDGQGRRVADALCPRPASGSTYGGYHGGAGYGWWYLSRGSTVPAVGSRLTGGQSAPTAGHSYMSAPSVLRGGFGFSSRAGG